MKTKTAGSTGRKPLLAWLGMADLEAARNPPGHADGPILSALRAFDFTELHLLSDHAPATSQPFVEWLQDRSGLPVFVHGVTLVSPTSHQNIYEAVLPILDDLRRAEPTAELTFHLSPGTPAMAAIWLLLARTRHPARLIETSREQGPREVHFPFELSAEFAPRPDAQADANLSRMTQGLPPATPAFTSIIHRCAAMQRTIAIAHRLALREVPVLIQGESGTGKELFARAIHTSSARGSQAFVAINCGAIPPELIDAELFGHEKGAFTGATNARAGVFESADGGTLFLDEIGELPSASQVRLLRVLQEREVTRVGATRPRPINVRMIAATNRVLPTEVAAGRFREDLFYRLAVGVLLLPPLRERGGDLSLLIDSFLATINEEATSQPAYQHKKISVGARNLLLQHPWPGNVRELYHALLRASIWSTGAEITIADVAESLALTLPTASDHILGKPVAEGFSLPELMADVARHYLARALAQVQGNKTEAAKLLGLGSYQTLTNWLGKYGSN